jgi:hypothetical protein
MSATLTHAHRAMRLSVGFTADARPATRPPREGLIAYGRDVALIAQPRAPRRPLTAIFQRGRKPTPGGLPIKRPPYARVAEVEAWRALGKPTGYPPTPSAGS